MHTVELSSAERRQLLAVLRELNDTPVEKRRSPRRKVLLNLWVRKIRGSGQDNQVGLFQAKVVNVSEAGVALVVRRPLAEGDLLAVPLRFREGGGWLVLCEVRNCRRYETGEYRVGTHFRDRIEDPDGDAKVPADWVM
jgi:hypothetical protein